MTTVNEGVTQVRFLSVHVTIQVYQNAYATTVQFYFGRLQSSFILSLDLSSAFSCNK